MDKNRNEMWARLDDLNVAKIFILFTAKNGGKRKQPEVVIQSIMVTTKCGNNNIDWDHDIYSFDSSYTKPIFESCQSLSGKLDGMLVYNNEQRKVTMSGTKTVKVREKVRFDL